MVQEGDIVENPFLTVSFKLSVNTGHCSLHRGCDILLLRNGQFKMLQGEDDTLNDVLE